MLKNKSHALRTILAVFLFVVLAFTAYTGVTAYLTDEEVTVNELTPGKNDITIVEEFPEPTPSPNMTYKKSVQVRNDGSTKAFVRVLLKFSDNRVEDLSEMSSNGTTFYPASRSAANSYYTHLPSGWVYIPEEDNTNVSITLDGVTHTAKRGELLGGYFYYTGILNANQATSKLVDTFRTTFADEESMIPFDIYVYAESVQPYMAEGTAATASQWETVWSQFIGKKSYHWSNQG